MKTFLSAFVLAVGLVVGFSGPVQASENPLTVVELYTSQGCSSCPPADAYLGKLAARPDILALSFHVDYWDYIGWKDPFADRRFTARQRAFSVIFAQRYVYTPQMIVHGAYQVVGSQAGDIEGAISKARAMPAIAVSLKQKGTSYQVDLPASPDYRGINVIAVFYDKMHETAIKRGENAGQKLANYNVVRDFVEVALWNGEARQIGFEKANAKGETCAVLLQSAQTGQIVGAAKLAGKLN